MIEVNKIYCGQAELVLLKIPDNFIDCTITSPPYDNLRDYEGYAGFDFHSIAKQLYRVTKENGVIVWIVNDATKDGNETGTSFKQALYFKEIGFKLHDTMIYERETPYPQSKRYKQNFEYMFILVKGNIKTFNQIKDIQRKQINTPLAGGHRQKDGTIAKLSNKAKQRMLKANANQLIARSNVWKYAVGYMQTTTDKTAYKHPATFPEKLVKDHIITWTNEKDIILDCFMGSGTTAKVSHLLNRKFIGIEISEKYCKIAQQRIAPYINNLYSNITDVIINN